jgi:hypothetical protein
MHAVRGTESSVVAVGGCLPLGDQVLGDLGLPRYHCGRQMV